MRLDMLVQSLVKIQRSGRVCVHPSYYGKAQLIVWQCRVRIWRGTLKWKTDVMSEEIDEAFFWGHFHQVKFRWWIRHTSRADGKWIISTPWELHSISLPKLCHQWGQSGRRKCGSGRGRNTLLSAVAEEGRGAVIKCRNLQNIKEFLFSSERERDAGR